MYTIAGVAVVISGAGVVYYLSDSRQNARSGASDEVRKASKKERRRAKKEKERSQEGSDAGITYDQPPRPTEKGMIHVVLSRLF